MSDFNRLPDSGTDRRRPDEDGIGALIRLAGRRQTAAPERVERVKRTVRDHWVREVRRRSRRRAAWWTVGVADAAALVVAVGLGHRNRLAPREPLRLARIEAVTHPVWIRPPGTGRTGAARVIGIGTTVTPGSELATEATGRLALTLPSGASIRLDVDTRVRFLAAGEFSLDRGAVYVDTGSADADPSLTIRTVTGIVRHLGTQFEVRTTAADAIRIRVREGRVVLDRTADTIEVAPGEQIEIGTDGPGARRPIPIWGTEWDWLTGITPPVRLDGLNLDSFLHWLVRERGWRLEYDDDLTAAAAGDTTLSGSMDGLSLDQALDAVLVTSRMTYRIEPGVLRIATEEAVSPGS